MAEVETGIARQSYDADEPLRVVWQHRDGSRWVRLTPAACDREGRLMRHCVGQDIYVVEVATGETALYSLRDQRNQPHVTIEFDNGGLRLAQVKGKANSVPSKYSGAICEFLTGRYRRDRFDLGVEAITDLLALRVLFDGERFAAAGDRLDPQLVARAFVERLQF